MLYSFLFYKRQWTLNYGDNVVISTFSDSQNLKTNVWIVSVLFVFPKIKKRGGEYYALSELFCSFVPGKVFPTVN